jgi:hypothetical protein
MGNDLDMLINLFERIHFFLKRLTNYAGIPLTEALTELLGKIMAQLLSLLALSTKMMTDKIISELSHFPGAFLGAEYDPGKLVKKLMGRNDVEDALLRLDSLTKEECLMVAARNLDVTHHVDRVVRDVHGNLKVTRKLTEDVDQKLDVIEWVTRNVDDNVKATKCCTQVFLSLVYCVPVHFLTTCLRNSNGGR